MGYSIACPARSKKLRDDMLAFMEKNFRPWPDLTGRGGDMYASEPTMHLSYDQGKCRVGFNYGPLDDGERLYIYTVTNWMCFRIGKRRQLQIFHSHGKLVAPVHYYVYDGHEACPLPLVTEFKDHVPDEPSFKFSGWPLYYENGWSKKYHCTSKFSLPAFLMDERRRYGRTIVKEMKRLTQLWSDHCEQSEPS